MAEHAKPAGRDSRRLKSEERRKGLAVPFDNDFTL